MKCVECFNVLYNADESKRFLHRTCDERADVLKHFRECNMCRLLMVYYVSAIKRLPDEDELNSYLAQETYRADISNSKFLEVVGIDLDSALDVFKDLEEAENAHEIDKGT